MARCFVRDEAGDVFHFSRAQEQKAFSAVELILNRGDADTQATAQRYEAKESGLRGWAVVLTVRGAEVSQDDMEAALLLCRTAVR